LSKTRWLKRITIDTTSLSIGIDQQNYLFAIRNQCTLMTFV
jgi:hypothetical protein